jgi:hypothetical protein
MRTTSRSRLRVPVSLAGFAVVAFVLAFTGVSRSASADLGAPVFDRLEGGYRVVAFASPMPIRVGPSEWNVFVLDARTGEPLPDAALRMTFERHDDDDPHAAHRHPGPARNTAMGRGGISARIEFDAPGSWQWQVDVTPSGGRDEPGAAWPRARSVISVSPRACPR